MDTQDYQNIRIIYVLKSLAQKAGLDRVIADKINYLARLGYEINLVTYEQGQHPLSYDIHPSVKHFDLDTRFFALAKYPLLLRLYHFIKMKKTFRMRLRKIVRDTEPSIIITTTYSLKIAKELLKEKRNAKTIIESHINFDSVLRQNDYHNFVLKSLFKLYDKINLNALNKYDVLVALTNSDASQWKNLGINVCIIPNPVTLYPKMTDTIKPEYNRILAVGRLNHQKGFDKLISAFSLISNDHPLWHIDIYGHGELREELQKDIIKRGLENRIIINPPKEDIYHEYFNSDFYVLSSSFEGLPLVLIEAMSCALPCVSFDCPYGPSEIITDGIDGLLVRNGNVEELAQKMAWMITHPEERKEMAKKARKNAEKYKIDNIMKQWHMLFNTLIPSISC